VLEWVGRGLLNGVVTVAYPRRPAAPEPGFRGPVTVLDGEGAGSELEELCPTAAISVEGGRVALDRGRCVQCGACVAAAPGRFRFESRYETAARARSALVAGARPGPATAQAGRSLGDHSAALRRSVHIRHVDAGSDGAEEWEIYALGNPYYDMQRLGLYFTLSPRHADVLLVTGGVTSALRAPLERAFEVMPAPKAVVAVGTDACSGGFAGDGETAGGVDRVLPVDVYVPGSPPSPIAILHGLLLAAGIVTRGAAG
jgi:Ni,Fe-hydrogenase III small subunit/ferredoxin